MKQLILIGALLEGGSLTTHGQTIETMLQQLSSLEQLRKATGDGYKEVVNDLHHIENITTGDLTIHDAYFLSLNEFNPAILKKKTHYDDLWSVQVDILDAIFQARDYYRYLKGQIINNK